MHDVALWCIGYWVVATTIAVGLALKDEEEPDA